MVKYLKTVKMCVLRQLFFNESTVTHHNAQIGKAVPVLDRTLIIWSFNLFVHFKVLHSPVSLTSITIYSDTLYIVHA